MNLSRSFPSSLTYLKQKKAGQKNHFSKKQTRSEEHTSELQSRFGISYAVFCLKKKPKS